ncbi:MAG: hypothetical protein GF347_04230 [Candidatus Moranbacteria bacterium]|nr:hypothetical protein [Candidatus Moranbacteria bacterium]
MKKQNIFDYRMYLIAKDDIKNPLLASLINGIPQEEIVREAKDRIKRLEEKYK